MSFDHYKKEGFIIVEFSENRLDAAHAVAFKDYMLELISSGEYRIVLDLSSVNFMDSSGLGAVVAIKKQLMQEDKASMMHLVSPQPAVRDLLDLTCMDKVFTILDSLDDIAHKEG